MSDHDALWAVKGRILDILEGAQLLMKLSALTSFLDKASNMPSALNHCK